jgi:membrane-bound lytic murein transglycosylase B
VHLIAGGHTYSQRLVVAMDPRVTAPRSAIVAQYALASRIAAAMARTYDLASHTKDAATAKRYRALNGQLAAMLDLVEGGDAAPTANLDSTAGALIGGLARGGRTPLTLQGEDEP